MKNLEIAVVVGAALLLVGCASESSEIVEIDDSEVIIQRGYSSNPFPSPDTADWDAVQAEADHACSQHNKTADFVREECGYKIHSLYDGQYLCTTINYLFACRQ